MKTKSIIWGIIFFLPFKVVGQMMFAPDNQIRAPISPSAVFQTELVAWWMENHSGFGQTKTGSFLIGFTLHDDFLPKKAGNIGGGLIFKFENHDFWTETSFSFPFGTQVRLSKDWKHAVGFAPRLKVYSQPRELIREQYYDPTLMSWVKNQTQVNLDLGYSLEYRNIAYIDIFATNIVRYIFSNKTEAFRQLPTYGLNTAYTFGKEDTRFRLGIMGEISGFGENKTIWLVRPSIQTLFLNEQVWVKYTLLKANSLQKNEIAHRFVVGLGSYWNINFAYTFGNSAIYRNSQGNFELFMTWNFDKQQNPDKTRRALRCSQILKKKVKKIFR